MNVIKVFFFLPLLIILILSCGKKIDPIPKSSLNIPPPAMVEMQIVNNGIEIINKSDNDTVLIERQETSGRDVGFFSRVAVVKHNSSYTDTQVEKGRRYNYRFRNYYPEYKTYSKAIVQSISYTLSIELEEVSVEVALNSLCVFSKMNDDIAYADIVINGKFFKKIYNEQITCINLPSVALINLLLIPYNSEGVSGIVYTEKISRDEHELLLPPQNLKVLRSVSNIVLSWDKGADINEYIIYIINGAERKLLQRSEATIMKYNLKKGEDCIEFLIQSKRGDFLSEPLNISSCG